MKAITIIIAAALALQVNVLFAGNDINSTSVSNANNTITLTTLAPTTPAEADFEDISYESVITMNLAPVVPETADADEEIDYVYLAPAIPVVADIE